MRRANPSRADRRFVIQPRPSRPGNCRSTRSLRASPLHRHAVELALRLTDKLRAALTDGVFRMPIETPLRVHRERAILMCWEAALGLISTVLRRPESVDQFQAA